MKGKNYIFEKTTKKKKKLVGIKNLSVTYSLLTLSNVKKLNKLDSEINFFSFLISVSFLDVIFSRWNYLQIYLI